MTFQPRLHFKEEHSKQGNEVLSLLSPESHFFSIIDSFLWRTELHSIQFGFPHILPAGVEAYLHAGPLWYYTMQVCQREGEREKETQGERGR